MRVVFWGTPGFTIPCLEAIVSHGYDLVGIVTQPNKPAGRGRIIKPPPVKLFAQERGVPAIQPRSLKEPEFLTWLRDRQPQIMVVAGYGKIVPIAALEIPAGGTINVHPSLLPRHRGASPVASAILAGDKVTGVSIMVMDAGMDTGPLLAQQEEVLWPEDTTEVLTRRLFLQGAQLLKQELPRYMSGEVVPGAQPQEGVTYTRLLTKKDGEANWGEAAATIERRWRAYTPWPGLYTYWEGKILKVLGVRLVDQRSQEKHGRVIPLGLEDTPAGVVTARGVLGLQRIQMQGKREMTCAEFVRGHRSFVGSLLA